MNRLSSLLVTVVVASAISVAGVAVAASAMGGTKSSPTTFYACQAKNGTITKITTDSKLTCAGGAKAVASEKVVSWNSVGPMGAPGPAGAMGAQGPAGATGAPGASGVNNPLVFGPYTTTGDPDSNVCGGNWATDAFTRTYIVTPQSNGSFDVTEVFKGSFVTIAGAAEPNDSACTTSQTGGVTGVFYGDYALNLAAPADFNPNATCAGSCSTASFFSTFFNGAAEPGSYAWEFYYTTPHNGSWQNTDHGNTGEITG